MKKFILSIVFAVMSFIPVISQNPNQGTQVKKFEYCELTYSGNFGVNSTIEADFGEKKIWFKTNKLTNEKGRKLKFNTVVDALNYMGIEGWELVQVYTVPLSEMITTQHYVFKKEMMTEIPVIVN